MNGRWLVWVPDNGETEDDGREVNGGDAECVAENYAEYLCGRDPDYYATFIDRGGMTMHVREVGSSKVDVFSVTGETVVTFRAVERTEKKQ